MKLSDGTTVSFRQALAADVDACFKIEEASYPADEAASLETLRYRQDEASKYFQCATIDDNVAGFVCSTRCNSFDHDSLTTHVESGSIVAIHSVAVAEPYRRKGLATALLQNYVTTLKDNNDATLESIMLMAKQHLLGFYVKAGFQVTRPSPIVHGSELWFELVLDLKRPCYVVDSFCDVTRRGTGNPAAVVLLDQAPDSEEPDSKDVQWMQTVSQEFNLAETAYIWPVSSKGRNGNQVHFAIRYYTPTIEVPLCGHATLAAASVLYQVKELGSDTEIVFHARQDELKTRLAASDDAAQLTSRQRRIAMEFPSKPAKQLTSDGDRAKANIMVEQAFGIDSSDIQWIGLSDVGDLLIEVPRAVLAGLGNEIKYSALMDWDGYSRGVIICCRGDAGSNDSDSAVSFSSRFFGPKAGINEDPVTGSAHCVLAPYFCKSTETMIARQCSQRGGLVECTMLPPSQGGVRIVGTAVTTMQGQLV